MIFSSKVKENLSKTIRTNLSKTIRTFIHFFTWGGSEWQQKEDLEKALPGFSFSAAEKGDKTEGFDG